MPGAAKAADHFIGDQQDIVFPADALDFRPVIHRRNEHAGRALDRFTDKSGNAMRAEFQNFSFQFLCALQSEFFQR